MVNGARLASIGPITSDAIRCWNRQPDAEASAASLRGAVVRMLSE